MGLIFCPRLMVAQLLSQVGSGSASILCWLSLLMCTLTEIGSDCTISGYTQCGWTALASVKIWVPDVGQEQTVNVWGPRGLALCKSVRSATSEMVSVLCCSMGPCQVRQCQFWVPKVVVVHHRSHLGPCVFGTVDTIPCLDVIQENLSLCTTH